MLGTVYCILLVVDCNVLVNEYTGDTRYSVRLLLERLVRETERADFV